MKTPKTLSQWAAVASSLTAIGTAAYFGGLGACNAIRWIDDRIDTIAELEGTVERLEVTVAALEKQRQTRETEERAYLKLCDQEQLPPAYCAQLRARLR